MALNILGLPIQLQATPLQVQDLLQGLQPGELLRGRVVELLPQGKAVINLRGQNIVAQLPPETPGTQVPAKGDILTLQVIARDPQAASTTQAKSGQTNSQAAPRAAVPTPTTGVPTPSAPLASPVLTLRLLPAAMQILPQAPTRPAPRIQQASQQLVQALAAAQIPPSHPALRAASTLARLGAPLDPATLTHVIKTAEALLAVETQPPDPAAGQPTKPAGLPEPVRQALREAVAVLKWASTQAAPGRDVVAVKNALQSIETILQSNRVDIAVLAPAPLNALPRAVLPQPSGTSTFTPGPLVQIQSQVQAPVLPGPLSPPIEVAAAVLPVASSLQALNRAIESLAAGKPHAPALVAQALQDLGLALRAQSEAAVEPAQLALFKAAPDTVVAAPLQNTPTLPLPLPVLREAASALFFRLAAPLMQQAAAPLTAPAMQALATQLLIDAASDGSPLQRALLDVASYAPAAAPAVSAALVPPSLPGQPAASNAAIPVPPQAVSPPAGNPPAAASGQPAFETSQPNISQVPLAALQEIVRQFTAQPLPATVPNLPALRQIFEDRGLPAPQAPLATLPPETVFEAVALLQAKGLPLQRPLVEAIATQSAAAEKAQVPAQRLVELGAEIPPAFSQLRPELGQAIQTVDRALRESGLNIQAGRLLQQLSHLVQAHGLDLEARLAAIASPGIDPAPPSQSDAAMPSTVPSLKEALHSARVAVHQASLDPAAAVSKPLAQILQQMGAEISQALSTLHAVQVSAQPSPAVDVTTLPLPVWVGGQLEGGQLSVYWRNGREHKLDEKEPVNVVLALDTRGLGPVRVQLQVWKDSCRCQVRAEDPENADFLASGADDLREALTENTPFDLQSLDFGTLSKALQLALGPLGATAPEPRGLSIQA